MKLAIFAALGTILSLAAVETTSAIPPGLQGKSLVVALQGTATAQPRVIQLPEGPVEAMCFDVDMIDLETGEVIGTGTDCLYNIQETNNGLTLTDVTIFQFNDGRIMSKSEVEVQAVANGFPNVSHLTGSVPEEGHNSILRSSGRYRNAAGRVRLSGAVDMSSLESNGQMTFNCIFVIELD